MFRTPLLALLFLGMHIFPAFGGEEADVTVLSSDDSGCEVEFSPRHFDIVPQTIEGTLYVRADFDYSSFEGNPGDPRIPTRVLVIGLPPEGGVNIRVATGPLETRENSRMLPLSGVRREGNMPVDVYEEGEAYRAGAILPGKFWAADEPEMMGAQRIVRIRLYPVQYDPSSGRIHWCSKMSIHIDFQTMGKTGVPFQPASNEGLYRSVLLNYETAKAWRISKSRRLAKSNWTFGPGPWYKIPVTEEGVYKVAGSFLKDRGVEIGEIDPATLKIYNNGGRMVDRSFAAERPQTLIETPILVFGMEDGKFDESDYFIFHGKGITGWQYKSNTFSHYGNLYTDTNFYWLTFNDGVAGKRIETRTVSAQGGEKTITTFWDHLFYEQDIYNPEVGGIHWLGQVFSRDIPSRSYDVTLTDLAATDSVFFRVRVWSDTFTTNRYRVTWNGSLVANFAFGQRYQTDGDSVTGAAVSGQNTLALTYSGASALNDSYLDWYEVFYLRNLQVVSQRLSFSSPIPSGVYRYQVGNLAEDGLILDVTDPSSIRRMSLSETTGKKEFVDETGEEPRVYYAINPDGFMTPSNIEKRTIQNLRNPQNGADLVIISHADFFEQAQRLKTHKETFAGLDVLLTDIQNVFDEFSWGLYDPTAIRDFMAYVWENWSKRPGYLLLFGDGDYDYRNILGKSDKNWIPPFEENGYGESGARATDDWYVMVSGFDAVPDLAVGRFPVQTQSEARIVIDKIIRYEAEPVRGAWRNLITLVSDDEITPDTDSEWNHMSATLQLVNSVIPASYNIKPVYLSEYPAEVLFDRRRKPKAQEDLVSQLNRGTVFINYIGHANEDLWADEWIFVRSEDMQKLENGDRMPVIYAATCSFGLYDNYQKSSFAEDLVVSERRGAVAVIAASRDCHPSENESLNRRFIRNIFPASGPAPRLGDAFLAAKIDAQNGVNDEMYHILGDPTLMLATPRYLAVFTEVSPDSFKALHVQTASGTIQKDGAEWADFQGSLALQAFDSRRETTYMMANGLKKTYSLPGNTLFRGEARVENGRFDIAFIVPKDITYGSASGRLSGYLYNEEADGSVFFNNIPIGGGGLIDDNRGPDLALCFEGHETFVSGGLVSENPTLVAIIMDDKTGVNITGDIGHKIFLDLDDADPLDLTEYFQYDEGSYLKGKLTYPLSGLSEGKHTLSLKAWDNANNSAAEALEFQIVPAGEIRIEEVLSYPNPMDDATNFTFQINRDAEIDIKIFTVSGRQIRHLSGLWGQPGFNMIPWDGRDQVGDAIANGVYLYKITARAQDGDKSVKKSEIGRLMMMHP